MVEIKGEEHAKMVQLALEYDPGPPFDSGAPDEPSATRSLECIRGSEDWRAIAMPFRAISEKLAAAA